MTRGNPNIAEVRKGRKKTGSRLFIKVNEEFGVTTDDYNVTLSKIYHDEKNGRVIPLGQRYHNTFQDMVRSLKYFEIPEEAINSYEEKVKGIKTHYEKGKLIVELPEGFESDPNPFSDEDKSEDGKEEE